jgi:imidazolonepropionase-like amidohydrolase
VEHCTFLTAGGVEVEDWVLERLAQRRTFVGATAAVVPGARAPPQIVRSLEQVGRSVSSGGRSASDADVGPAKPHGVLAQGVVHLAHLGLTNADALASVTTVPAENCGLADYKGRIAPGFDADLLAVDGNPVSEIEALLRVVAVFRAGVPVALGPQQQVAVGG